MRTILELPAVLALFFFNGCTDRVDEPPITTVARPDFNADAAAIGDATASVRWSTITRDYIASKEGAAKPSPVAAFRAFAYLSLAQYRAALSADEDVGPPPHGSAQGAVAAASSVVLSALFPGDAAFFASQLAVEEGEEDGSEKTQNSFAAGEVIGRSVGAQVVEQARGDRFNAVWTGNAPIGPGYWTSDFDPPRPPQLPLLGQMRPFLMESADQFRPGPPPALGSPEFLAALAEIRQLSDNRTPDQLRIAQFWAMTSGSLVSGFWNEETTKRIARYHLDERRAARALALVHMAAMDATIACYDAKYTYWFIRPYKADRAITVPIPKPNHPSYPSAHACSSSAAANVLAALFPADAAQLTQMADEAGESRLYGGIHYRFDKDGGLEIGRQVAALALRHRNEDAKDE